MRVAAPSPAPSSPLQYFVKAECWASQKKSSKYNQKLLLTGTVEEYGVKVEHAHCTCPAGIAGDCQHVVVCLSTMEKCKEMNITTSFPPPESCTSLQCAWGPRRRSISPQALQEVVAERAKCPEVMWTVWNRQQQRERSQPLSLALCIKQGQVQH